MTSRETPVAAAVNPADVARAALRHLAQQRLAPTPENYARAWVAAGGGAVAAAATAGADASAASAPLRPIDYRSDAMAEAAEAIKTANRKSKLLASMVDLVETICLVVPMLVEDEAWVVAQFEVLRKVIRPESGSIDRRDLAQARQLLVATAEGHQKLLKLRRDSLEGLKELLSRWMSNVAGIEASSQEYGAHLDGFARRIETVGSLNDLATTLAGIVEETHALKNRLNANRGEFESARQRAEELENTVTYLSEQLNETSTKMMTDHLTELMNRRGLLRAFDEVWFDCQAQERPLCLALLDLDDFKRLNDSHGHQTGDEALRHLARLLQGKLGADDKCARYGGEEFVVLLPGSSVEAAVEAVKRVQRSLAADALLSGGMQHQITFSAGITQVAGARIEDALERADDAMYEAKRTGKNRVCWR